MEALGTGRLHAEAVAFDSRVDVAVLRVRDLDARPSTPVEPDSGDAVAILGYPENGPFTAVQGGSDLRGRF